MTSDEAERKVKEYVPDAEPHMGIAGWGIHSRTYGSLTVAAPTLSIAWKRAFARIPAKKEKE